MFLLGIVVVVELYAVPTSSSRDKDVGGWDVGRSEARLFSFVYLALGANLLHYEPYPCDCGASVWFGLALRVFFSRQHRS